MAVETFDRVGDSFVSYYNEVRGYVREQMARDNLAPFLNEMTISILDVGGGDGRDAIWLAQRGYGVRIVDPSENMASKARRAAKEQNLSELVQVDCGDPAEILKDVTNEYDLVMSHGVMMYLDDPQAHLGLLARVVKREGVVSILTKGRNGSLVRLLNKQDYQAAIILRQTGRLTNNLGENVLAVNFDDMEARLVEADLHSVARFGVRIATDNDRRLVHDIPDKELKTILDCEHLLGSDPTTMGLGQMLHFICKPNGGIK